MEIDATKMERFREYAETITAQAFQILKERAPRPETEEEIALHLAYVDGLMTARGMQLPIIAEAATSLCIDICRKLLDSTWFEQHNAGMSITEYMAYLFKDDRELQEMWGDEPQIAEAISFWHAFNDAHEFVMCFITDPVYVDDFRSIRKAVELSLTSNKLHDMRQAIGNIVYEDFGPSGPRQLPMGGSTNIHIALKT